MAQPLRAVERVDLSRYMGSWYVIANIPYFAERDCIDSVEHYSPSARGRIRVRFSCRRKSPDAPMQVRAISRASIVNRNSNAVWRVWVFGLIPIRYVIIDLDADYHWAVVGHPSRRYGWIMARTRALSALTYQAILRRLGDQGYDVGQFRAVPQSASVSSTADSGS